MFKSIDEMGGIEQYLNDTKEDHNGLGYRDLRQRVRLHVALYRMANDFGVSYRTIKYRWIPLMEDHEQSRNTD